MIVTEARGATLVLTVDRRATRNALDRATAHELTRAARELPAGVKAVIVTGAGGSFVSGGDLRELRAVRAREETEALCDEGRAMCDALEEANVPVVAAIEGAALGGGAELACACDLRVMAEDAILGFRQVRMGVTTAWGTYGRLAAMVGATRAAELVLSARDVRAPEALALGLVERVAPAGEALAGALALCDEIGRGAPLAVAGMKELLRARRRDPALRDLERRRFIETWMSADHGEAVEAWLERRPPRFGP